VSLGNSSAMNKLDISYENGNGIIKANSNQFCSSKKQLKKGILIQWVNLQIDMVLEMALQKQFYDLTN
jgi:hypothetical protein